MRQRGGSAPTRVGAAGLAAPLGAKGHRHARPAGRWPLEPGIGPRGLCVTLSARVANTCGGCGAVSVPTGHQPSTSYSRASLCVLERLKYRVAPNIFVQTPARDIAVSETTAFPARKPGVVVNVSFTSAKLRCNEVLLLLP